MRQNRRYLGVQPLIALVVVVVVLSASYCNAAGSGNCCTTTIENEIPLLYGTEVSWPMQHSVVNHPTRQHQHSDDNPDASLVLLQQQQQRERYQTFMAGCAKRYGSDRCTANDDDRIQLNARQPPLQHNFTSTGYAVVTLPTQAWGALERFWRKRVIGQHHKATREHWEHGSIYTNHWESPTFHVPLVEQEPALHEKLVEQVQTVLEKWAKTPLIPTSTYGIRVYTNGSILTPHVDRYVYT
jgi:hypothetical protein